MLLLTDDLSEYAVVSVQPGGIDSADEELRRVVKEIK